jgi:hypothetical protein
MSRTFNYFVEEESSTVAGGQGSEDEDGNTDSKGVALTEKQRKQQKGNNILFIVCLYLYCRSKVNLTQTNVTLADFCYSGLVLLINGIQ